ncbi:MAG: hypothetical protein ACREPH_12330 [Rhodanobacteraceae bacterium]
MPTHTWTIAALERESARPADTHPIRLGQTSAPAKFQRMADTPAQ